VSILVEPYMVFTNKAQAKRIAARMNNADTRIKGSKSRFVVTGSMGDYHIDFRKEVTK